MDFSIKCGVFVLVMIVLVIFITKYALPKDTADINSINVNIFIDDARKAHALAKQAKNPFDAMKHITLANEKLYVVEVVKPKHKELKSLRKELKDVHRFWMTELEKKLKETGK